MTVNSMSLRDRVMAAVHSLIVCNMTDFGSQAVYDKKHEEYPEEVTQDPRAQYVHDKESGKDYLIGMSHHTPHTFWVWVAPLYGDEEEPGCIIPDWSTWADAIEHADLMIRQLDCYEGMISTVDQIYAYMLTEQKD